MKRFIFKENGNPFWFLLSFLLAVSALLFLSGCAGEDKLVKPTDVKPPTKVAVKTNPGANMVLPKPVIVKEVLHFYTFKTEPAGAGVYVIDTQSGKETAYLGTTPVRILVMKKKVEIDGFVITCTGVSPNVLGLPLNGKSGKIDLIEYQFKFKMQGYYDEMKIERLLLNTGDSTEQTISATLYPGGKK